MPERPDDVIRAYPTSVKLNSTGWVVAKGKLYLAKAPPWTDIRGDWTPVFDNAIRTESLDEARSWVRLLGHKE